MKINEKIDKFLEKKKYSGVEIDIDVVLTIKTQPFSDNEEDDAGFDEAEGIATQFCKQIKKIKMKNVTVKSAEPTGSFSALQYR